MDLPLALLLGNAGALVLGHAAAHVAGELRAEVEGKVFLVLVEQAQLGALVGVDDGQDASDGLAKVVAVNKSSVSSFACLPVCVVRPLRVFRGFRCNCVFRIDWVLRYAHFLGLRRGTTDDLLDTELGQLDLQLVQLLGEIILALSPELTSLDLGCRLCKKRNVSD